MDDPKWIKFVICILMLMRVNGLQVPITYVKDAVAKGAVCLDGSPPAYHFHKGFGGGVNNWLIQLEGGGVCYNTSCYERAKKRLGSSTHMKGKYTFSAILSNKAKHNPDFYNWNRVKVRYCDGSCYTGDVEAIDPNKEVYYRGARVWRAVMDDLLAKGMKNAQNAILSGCSAGGMGTIFHCDQFHSLLPAGAKVKCLSDAGFVINIKDITGKPYIQQMLAQVLATHGSAKNLPVECTSKYNAELCFFTEYAARFVKTPLFLLNSDYDSWQIRHSFAPEVADPQGQWKACRTSLLKCSSSQLQTLLGFRKMFLAALDSLGNSSTRGYYINSCFVHCQSKTQGTWFSADSPRLDNTTIANAIGEWFFDRKIFRAIDCPYPCDKTCHNQVLH